MDPLIEQINNNTILAVAVKAKGALVLYVCKINGFTVILRPPLKLEV
jgi:hypothetical protein